jgi:hypothetical protein
MLIVGSLLSTPAAGIKKGHKGPECAPPHLRMASAISGDALSYDYERLSNKIAHRRVLSSFPCAVIFDQGKLVKQGLNSKV